MTMIPQHNATGTATLKVLLLLKLATVANFYCSPSYRTQLLLCLNSIHSVTQSVSACLNISVKIFNHGLQMRPRYCSCMHFMHMYKLFSQSTA